MNWFDGMVSLPALSVLYGLTFAGRLGAIAGFVGGVVAGSLGLYLTTDDSTRVDKVARGIEALERVPIGVLMAPASNVSWPRPA